MGPGLFSENFSSPIRGCGDASTNELRKRVIIISHSPAGNRGSNTRGFGWGTKIKQSTEIVKK